MIELLPPAWVLILAAILIALTKGNVRNAVVLIAPLARPHHVDEEIGPRQTADVRGEDSLRAPLHRTTS